MYFLYLQEIEVLRKQNVQLSEENGKLVGHKNHKQRIEYLVKLKKENTKLNEVTHLKYMDRWFLLDLYILLKFVHLFCFKGKREAQIADWRNARDFWNSITGDDIELPLLFWVEVKITISELKL